MKLARYMSVVDRNGVTSYRYNPPADAVEAGVVKRESLGTSLVDAINKASEYNDDTILEMLTILNKPWNECAQEERMVKASLVEVYANRNGEESADILLDALEAVL